MNQKTYARAGVDIDLGNRVKAALPQPGAEKHRAVLGGEAAQMPASDRAGEYDVSGTIVGAVERARMLDGKANKPGDAVVGRASSGVDTNGYSVARKIFVEQMKPEPDSR